MRAAPSEQLIEQLNRLELASPADVRRVYRRARWLAGDLTQFDSVWVDALAQAERLSPFQAAELNAGRGDALRVGPFALRSSVSSPAWTRGYHARTTAPGTPREARLVTVDGVSKPDAAIAIIHESMRRLAACAVPQVAPMTECGVEGTRLWATAAPVAGRTANEWLVHCGRMQPEVVHEIARQMAIGMLALERAGQPHGDVSIQNVVLDPIGVAQLVWPGLRCAVRPIETADAANWPAEAYDAVAPERMRGEPATVATDLYSCGIVWRHLLSGRPPFAPARSAAKLCAAQSGSLEAIERLAPQTPASLVAAIEACTSRDPSLRPKSAAALVEVLGPSTDRGQALLAHYLSHGATPPERFARRMRTIRRSRQLPTWSAVAVGAILALAAGTSPWWSRLLQTTPPLTLQQIQIASVVMPTAPMGTPPIPQGAPPLAEPRLLADVALGEFPSQPSPQMPSISTPTSMVTSRADGLKPTALQTQSVAPTKPILRQGDPAERVAQASASLPIVPTAAPRYVAPEFLLSSNRPIAWSSVQPLAGQTVKGRPGERPTIVVTATGAPLAAEGVRFENVDFVAAPAQRASALRVTARNAIFDGCTFGGAQLGSGAGVSLVWTPDAAHGSPAPAAELQIIGGELTCDEAAICCTVADDARVICDNTLHLGSGPLVCVEHAPARRAPGAQAELSLRISHCTARGGDALLELCAPTVTAALPKVRVEAIECVFAPLSNGALILVRGGAGPAEALRQVVWTGQGSVVTPGAHPVAWQGQAGRQPVADRQLAIEGLVRSELGFAGEAPAGRDASRLVRWQVPLRSPDPPGIGDMAQRPVRRAVQ